MTDENRFRAPRAHGFPQTQSASARVRRTEDPLAELARLIGQEDPFADFVAHRPADARAATPGANVGVQRRPRTSDPRGYLTERRRATPVARPQEPGHDEFDFDSLGETPRTNGRTSYAYGGGRVPSADAAPSVSIRNFRDDGEPQSHEDYDDKSDLRGHDPRADSRQARRAPAVPVDDEYEQFPAADYDPDYADDAYIPAHGEEFYDEVPRRRIKPWMMIAIVAVAVVAVGTSGLFAYRAVFGTNVASAPPKMIRPEAGPTKMVPGSDTKTADTGNKQIVDRVGGDSKISERIVSREEAPMDSNRIPQGSPSMRVPAGTVTPTSQFAAVPAQAIPVAPQPAAPTSTEPRRVRTVTVRADGTVVGPSAGTTGSTARYGAPSVSNSPMALQGNSTASQPVLPPQRPAAGAPQSDNPWANVANQPVTQQAALPPQAPLQPAPAPAIAVNTPPPAGSYVVQVAAQKTEADAQASWQALQQRYNSVLGGQQATIRRVDLGERGVFYRAQVGPFTSRAQASEVCQSLKAAGGECVIQRN